MAFATLQHKDAVKKLFDQIAPKSAERTGGYTRIIRLGQRKSDSASMAFIEWVDAAKVVEEIPAEEKKAKRKESEAKPKQKEPAAKQREPKPATKEAAPVPVEEPKPKKRRWFGQRSKEEAK